MANSLAVYSPSMWSKITSRILQKSTVFRSIASFKEEATLSLGVDVDRPYHAALVAEDYAKLTAATVQDISGTSQKLTIDKKKDIMFDIDKIDQKQNAIDVVALHSKTSAKALAITQDADFLYNTLSANDTVDAGDLGGTDGSPVSLSTANLDSVCSSANYKLDLQNVDDSDRVAVISPRLFRVLWERISGKESMLGDKTAEMGSVGTYCGFKLYKSNNLTASARWTPANNPSNNDTVTIQGITFTFVTSIGTTAGNVLIAGTTALTLTNLVALINAPGTTTANGVALSAANQRAVQMWVGVDGTTYADVRVKGGNELTVSGSDATDVWSLAKQHLLFANRGSIDMVVQKDVTVETSDLLQAGKFGQRVGMLTFYGSKMFDTGSKESLDVQIATA